MVRRRRRRRRRRRKTSDSTSSTGKTLGQTLLHKDMVAGLLRKKRQKQGSWKHVLPLSKNLMCKGIMIYGRSAIAILKTQR